jgi:hypothetical protein
MVKMVLRSVILQLAQGCKHRLANLSNAQKDTLLSLISEQSSADIDILWHLSKPSSSQAWIEGRISY